MLKNLGYKVINTRDLKDQTGKHTKERPVCEKGGVRFLADQENLKDEETKESN